MGRRYGETHRRAQAAPHSRNRLRLGHASLSPRSALPAIFRDRFFCGGTGLDRTRPWPRGYGKRHAFATDGGRFRRLAPRVFRCGDTQFGDPVFPGHGLPAAGDRGSAWCNDSRRNGFYWRYPLPAPAGRFPRLGGVCQYRALRVIAALAAKDPEPRCPGTGTGDRSRIVPSPRPTAPTHWPCRNAAAAWAIS